MDTIRPPPIIFFAFLKKITRAEASSNFPSPKSNGQGYSLELKIKSFTFLTFKLDTLNHLISVGKKIARVKIHTEF